MKKYFKKLTAVLLFIMVLSGCGEQKNVGWNRFQGKGEPLETVVCDVLDDRNSIVTVISDDGYYESGVILDSLAKELGLHVTVAGFVHNLQPYLKDWEKIEKEGFVEVISHSYSHLKIDDETNPSYEEIYHEYVDAREFFSENFSTPDFCFVTPNNDTTGIGYQILMKTIF